jgi:Ca2+-binding RTX toxin-like protein
MFSSFFKSARKASPRKTSPRKTARHCRIEALEERSMMAVTASLANGLLDVRGTSGNDTIIVRQIGNKFSIDGVKINGSGVVSKVQIQGFGGNDVLRMDGNGVAGQAVKIPGLIFGGDGNDFIVGGLNNDELQGNNGNDTLYGLEGRDLQFGQMGNDLAFGGAGDDQLVGGAGHDELLGESGHDKLWGDAGNDWLWGGTGDDYLDGGKDSDVAYGGTGKDTFRNLADGGFFLVHPHLKSPVRRLGDLGNYGVQDFSRGQGDN